MLLGQAQVGTVAICEKTEAEPNRKQKQNLTYFPGQWRLRLGSRRPLWPPGPGPTGPAAASLPGAGQWVPVGSSGPQGLGRQGPPLLVERKKKQNLIENRSKT